MMSGKNKIGPFIIMFLLLFIIVATIASLVYISQYRIIRNEKSNELNTLFKLKETQILNWLNERKSDARFFKNNSDMVFHFDQYLKNKGNVKFMENLNKYSTAITSTGHYKSLAFLDENYNVVYSFPDLSSRYVMKGIHPEYLDSARYSDNILNTDFHYTPDSQILFHIIVPLKNEGPEGQNFLGFLLLNIDPMDEFYPLFQTFQIYSNTAEALLVRKEGDKVIFLNELRHAKGSALKLKFPLNNQNLAAVKAIGGNTGTVDAEDYRGKKVLASIGPVTNTHWYLVVKLDKVEIFKDFRVFARNTWIMSILLIVIGTLLLRILWLRRSAESDKNYRELINGMNETVWLIGLDGNIIDVNKRAIKVLGYTKEELLSIGLHGIDSSLEKEKIAELVKNMPKEAMQFFETSHKTKDGSIIPVEINSSLVTYQGKRAILSIARDITERKTSEIELKKNNKFIQTLIDNLPIGLAVNSVEPSVTFEYMNENFNKIYDVSKEDLSAPDAFWEKVYEDAGFREEIKSRVLTDIASGDPEKMIWNDIPITRNGKLIRYISARNIPFEEGNFMISTVWDVTERKLIEQEIMNMNFELEKRVNERTKQLAAKNYELETFAYSVSHDLKAPLRGIDGYSRILLEEYSGSLDEVAIKYLNNVREGTMHMGQLIDDLLDYSRLERYNLNLVSISLLKFVKSTIDQVFNVYSAKNIKIENTIPDIQIIVDSRGLAIALRNLIENAVKFTGTIKNPLIELSFEDKEVSYILSVRDNGIGFDMQYHRKIFEIFQRLQRSEDYPGTGIGLAMVKKSMERLGGKVWAESIPGKGSAFYLEIPKI